MVSLGFAAAPAARARIQESKMRKLILVAIAVSLSTAVVHAEIYNYSCKACIFPRIVTDNGFDGCDVVDGKTYTLRVDTAKMCSNGGGRNTA